MVVREPDRPPIEWANVQLSARLARGPPSETLQRIAAIHVARIMSPACRYYPPSRKAMHSRDPSSGPVDLAPVFEKND
jgi:hypothetical protein